MSVSPDGQWLAFRSSRPQSDIFVVGTDGQEAYQVTDDLAVDISPEWSHDSERLTFYSTAENGNQAWVVNRDGGGRMRVSDVEDGVLLESLWSPDDQHIMFWAYGPDGGTFLARSDVPHDQQEPTLLTAERDERFGVNPDGTPALFRPLAWHHASNRVVGGSGVVFVPETGEFDFTAAGRGPLGTRWMHDGRRIIFESDDTVHVRDTITGEEWATEVSAEGVLRLSSDSRLIYRERTFDSSSIWMLEFKE
jgi:Tol biopolymer transport system component